MVGIRSNNITDTVKFNKVADLYAKQFVSAKIDTTNIEEQRYVFEWVEPTIKDRGQTSFHKSGAKYRIMICGRQMGKTKAGAQEVLRLAKDHTIGFVVAPTYWHTQRCWREILSVIGPHFNKVVKSIQRQERRIILRNNATIWFKSADNPDSLRSESLDWAWLDECALIKQQAWHAIEPALYGPVIMTTTPKGHNWVYELFTRGQDPLQLAYDSWNYPTSINPYYPKDKIKEAQRVLPELIFRQEYLGEFIEDIGAVFRGVKAHVRDIPLASVPHNRYVIGVDLAKHEDFTVLIALNVLNGDVCGFDRFQQLDWVFIQKRIINFVNTYNKGRVLVDSTGVGDPIYDQLRRNGVHCEGYKFTNSTKADLIENLSLMMDNDQIHYPDIPELLNELRLFGYEQSPSGTIRYHAPEGYHDDCVIALALAAWQISRPKGFVITV
jgi:hypothetical protein